MTAASALSDVVKFINDSTDSKVIADAGVKFTERGPGKQVAAEGTKNVPALNQIADGDQLVRDINADEAARRAAEIQTDTNQSGGRVVQQPIAPRPSLLQTLLRHNKPIPMSIR